MKFILNITVEPVIFLLAFSNGFSDSGQVNLILEKVCRSDLCKNAICERPENCLQQSTGKWLKLSIVVTIDVEYKLSHSSSYLFEKIFLINIKMQ